MIRLLVGLGNPGTEYEGTRHNAGFWWVDAAAQVLGGRLAQDRAYHGRVARVNRPSGPLWLLQPLTYMNLSGKSVAALARFFKITPQEILVVHDELDLLPGQMKLKLGGSPAGHNGLKDIHAQLGSDQIWRLKLGIGHPGNKAEVADYVLRKPPAQEREAIEKTIQTSLESLDLMLDGAMDKAMMKLHAKPQRPKPPRPAGLPTQAQGRLLRPDGPRNDGVGLRPDGSGDDGVGLRPDGSLDDGKGLRPDRSRDDAKGLRPDRSGDDGKGLRPDGSGQGD